MDSPVKQRLKAFIKHEGLSIRQFCLKIGVSPAFVANIVKSIQPDRVNSISNQFPDLNIGWLLTGEGEMLKADEHQQSPLSGKLIPFYDANAAAGNEYGMSMEPARRAGMIEIGSVLRDSESAIRVYGNSMVPNYPAGCVIGLKLHTDSFIEPGRVYVVETRANRYLKRLYYNQDRTCFHCLSDNQMKYEDGPRKGELYYQDFDIPINEVIRLHRVVGVIKRNIL